MNFISITCILVLVCCNNVFVNANEADGNEKEGLISLGPISTSNRCAAARGAGQNLYVSTFTASYFDALQYCNDQAVTGLADLVQITNVVIDNEINSKLLSQGPTPFWTSGIYTGSCASEGWRWYTTYNDAPQLTYTNWVQGEGQPILQNPGSSCISFTSSFLPTGRWRSVPCSQNMRFLCFY